MHNQSIAQNAVFAVALQIAPTDSLTAFRSPAVMRLKPLASILLAITWKTLCTIVYVYFQNV